MKSCGLFFLVVVVAMLGLIGLLYWDSLPTTNPYFYGSTMGELKKRLGNVSHFPESIPKEASHVRYYFDPGGFHGDYTFELRYELPPEEIEKLYQSYIARGTRFVPWDQIGRPGVKLYRPPPTAVTEDSFAPGFEFATIEELSGVAINRKTHEILFWAFST